MRIACLGGGPGGLVFTILAKKAFPSAAVELWDRNPAGATYGFGVVFSDEAMDAFTAPSWSVAEVTRDARFTGGRFVTMTTAELTALLLPFGIRRGGAS